MFDVPQIVATDVDGGNEDLFFVELDPSSGDVVFSGDFRSACAVGLTIRNRCGLPARFRVKTNRPRRLVCNPCEGSLNPHSSTAVILNANAFEYGKGTKTVKDSAFLVMVYVDSPSNLNLAESDSWSGIPSDQVQINRIRCLFDYTPANKSKRDANAVRRNGSVPVLDLKDVRFGEERQRGLLRVPSFDSVVKSAPVQRRSKSVKHQKPVFDFGKDLAEINESEEKNVENHGDAKIEMDNPSAVTVFLLETVLPMLRKVFEILISLLKATYDNFPEVSSETKLLSAFGAFVFLFLAMEIRYYFYS